VIGKGITLGYKERVMTIKNTRMITVNLLSTFGKATSIVVGMLLTSQAMSATQPTPLNNFFVFTDDAVDTVNTVTGPEGQWKNLGVAGELTNQANKSGSVPDQQKTLINNGNPAGMTLGLGTGGGQDVWLPNSSYSASNITDLANTLLNGNKPPTLPGYALTYPSEQNIEKGVIYSQDIEYIVSNPTNGYIQATLLLWALRQVHPKGDGSFATIMPVMGWSMSKSLNWDPQEVETAFISILGALTLHDLNINFVNPKTNSFYNTYPEFIYGNNLCDVIAIQEYSNKGKPYSNSTPPPNPTWAFPATTVPFILVEDNPQDKPGTAFTSTVQYNLQVGGPFSQTLPTDANEVYLPWTVGVYLGSDKNGAPISTPPSGMQNMTPEQIALSVPLGAENSATLNVSIDGMNGTIYDRVKGVYCRSNCNHVFKKGSTLTLRAKADEGYKLIKWVGACSGSRPICKLRMTKSQSVKAFFRKI